MCYQRLKEREREGGEREGVNKSTENKQKIDTIKINKNQKRKKKMKKPPSLFKMISKTQLTLSPNLQQ